MDHDHKHNEHGDEDSDEDIVEVFPNTQDPREWRKPGVFCPVCLAIHDGESVYALPCGHAYCLKVIQGLRPPRRNGTTIQCPMCRKKHPPNSHRRLFLTLRVPKDQTDLSHTDVDHDHEEDLSTKVNNLDEDSLPETVSSVADEVRQVAQKLRDDESDRKDKLSLLLDAFSYFLTRALPLWKAYTDVAHATELTHKALTAAEKATKELDAARDEARAMRRNQERLEREVSVLSTELKNARRDLDLAAETTKEWEAKMLDESKRNGRLQDSICQYKKKVVKHEKKIEDLERRLERPGGPSHTVATDADTTIAASSSSAQGSTSRQPARTRQCVDIRHRALDHLFPSARLGRSNEAAHTMTVSDYEDDTAEEYVTPDEEVAEDRFVDLDDAVPPAIPRKRPRAAASSSSHGPSAHRSGLLDHDDIPPPQRPRFSSGADWNLSSGRNGTNARRVTTSGTSGPSFPIQVDRKGRALGAVALGSRMPMNRNS